MTKVFQIRVAQEWEDQLDATIREMSTLGEDPPSRASFVRETIEMENLLWRRSPYVCDTSRHYVLVTSNGSHLYLRREHLHLRTDLQSIPAHLETRLGKRPLSSNLWALNAFVLKNGSSIEVRTDPEGTTSKSVSFNGPFIEGSRVFREGFFMLDGYTEFRHDSNDVMESLYDRADFEIDIPTRSLDILMVVDPRLYGENWDLLEPAPALRFDIRNRDGVVFSSPDAVGHFLRQTNLTRIGNRYKPGMETGRDDLYKNTIQLVRDGMDDCVASLDTIKKHAVESGLTADQVARARELMVLPDKFLFYRVSWTGAHIGLTCSLRFPKPTDVTKVDPRRIADSARHSGIE